MVCMFIACQLALSTLLGVPHWHTVTFREICNLTCVKSSNLAQQYYYIALE